MLTGKSFITLAFGCEKVLKFQLLKGGLLQQWRHDIQHNDTRLSDTQSNNK
jgi:hypothetical protein